jgi:hypothetical protein
MTLRENEFAVRLPRHLVGDCQWARTYSAVMDFKVDATAPGVVEAWSTTRLPFEPTGWLEGFRRQLATACRGLVATPGQILHATYASADRSMCDLENVLTYNLERGPGPVRNAATQGLILERSFTPVRGFRHHHRYELVPAARRWREWRAGKPLATLRFTTLRSVFGCGRTGPWWLAARTGDPTVHTPSRTVPDAYVLRLAIDPPAQWRGGLVGLLKPLTDGIVSAMHNHAGVTDVIADRAGVVVPHLSTDEFVRLLAEPRDVPLGDVRLLVPRGNGVQFHPADDQIVALDARIVDGGAPGTVIAEVALAEPVNT